MKNSQFKLKCTVEQREKIKCLVAENSVIDNQKWQVAEVIIRALEKLKEGK